MKYINVRQLLNNYKAFTEEKDLPLVVTKFGKPIFKIISAEDFLYEDVVVEKTELPQKNSKKISELKMEDIQITGGPTGPSVNASTFKLCKAKFCNNYAEEGSDFCKEHK